MKTCDKCGSPMAWIGITFEGFECIKGCDKVNIKVYTVGNVAYIKRKDRRKDGEF